jgi:hypothetical protein
MPAAMATKGAVPPPQRFERLLEPALFDAFRLYVRALARTEALSWEEWGQRRIRHNDPLAALIHPTLTQRVEEAMGVPVKPSYCFLACYGPGGRVPAHRDRIQCRYTLDLCLEDGQTEPWPLFIEERAYLFAPNEALLYMGGELTHHRLEKPAGSDAHLVFFHFVDADFEGPLG